MALPCFERLADRRIIFGHQSVGSDIVDGIRDRLREQPAGRWQLCDVADAPRQSGGFFAHARMGRNGDPASKTQEFCETVHAAAGNRLDVALHKYCYVDICASADIQSLFERHHHVMQQLRVACPSVTIVHVTVPLVSVRSGLVAWLRGAMGRASRSVADNAARERFNDLLRSQYTGHEPLFDLAALEAGAERTRSLRAEYTDDGGHLNTLGRQRVADGLLTILSGLPDAHG